MTTGERIKRARKEAGYSQIGMADQIGVSKQTMYKYENNLVANIPIDKIEAIAHKCNVSPAYLRCLTDDASIQGSGEESPEPVAVRKLELRTSQGTRIIDLRQVSADVIKDFEPEVEKVILASITARLSTLNSNGLSKIDAYVSQIASKPAYKKPPASDDAES